MKRWLFALVFSLLIASCANGNTVIPYPEETFDFSEFHDFTLETGYTSLFGYVPKPGIENAHIHRTPDNQMKFSIAYFLEWEKEICDSERIYCTQITRTLQLKYPTRFLSEEEIARVESTFGRITQAGWREEKMANCDPANFHVYTWDDQQFSDVFCWRNELTLETRQRVHQLLESLTRGLPSLPLTPLPENDMWN